MVSLLHKPNRSEVYGLVFRFLVYTTLVKNFTTVGVVVTPVNRYTYPVDLDICTNGLTNELRKRTNHLNFLRRRIVSQYPGKGDLIINFGEERFSSSPYSYNQLSTNTYTLHPPLLVLFLLLCQPGPEMSHSYSNSLLYRRTPYRTSKTSRLVKRR